MTVSTISTRLSPRQSVSSWIQKYANTLLIHIAQGGQISAFYKSSNLQSGTQYGIFLENYSNMYVFSTGHAVIQIVQS